MDNELTATVKEPESEICFNADTDLWALKITRNGIFFNREIFPNSLPDDFALAFIEILEKQFTVKFERKSPPYVR